MPITSIDTDDRALTITVVGDYAAPVERLWDVYADPRELERFWGPPGWPATFTRHDMAIAGESHYHMTGPDGAVSRGAFRFLAVEPNRAFEVEDVFVGEDGAPNTDLPTMRMRYAFEATPGGSRCTSTTWVPTAEALAQLLGMGMLEGTRAALAQLDGVLADRATFSADLPAAAQMLSDTRVRVSRVLRSAQDAVWRAHHEPALLQRWLLGPDGWTMPVCRVGSGPGDTFRQEWESADGTQRFGFEGEVLESSPPHREVTTERMLGTDGPATRNELTLTPLRAGTLLTLVITYPSRGLRDEILGTGMLEGMEASYARLEREILGS